MKKQIILATILGAGILLNSSVDAAPNQLTQKVADILHADQYKVTYKLVTISEDMSEETKKFASKNPMIQTYAKKNDVIFFASNPYLPCLQKDDEVYGWTRRGKAYISLKGKQNTVSKFVGSSREIALKMMDPFFMRYYLLPYVEEDNWAYSLTGEKVKANYCDNFVRIGEEIIDNYTYQFEEYTTPAISEIKQTTRYYFKDGDLVKVIMISSPAVVEGNTVPGIYTTVDVIELKNEFDTSILELPNNVKIDEYDELNTGVGISLSNIG